MEACSQVAGVVFEFEKAAMRGDPIPDGLSSEDQLLYIPLRDLYHQYHIKMISRDTAVADKKKLIRAHSEQKRLSAFGEECRTHAVKLWRDVEGAAAEYAHDRTLENADKLYQAVYGVGRPNRSASPC